MANRALAADDLSHSLEKLVMRFVKSVSWMYAGGRDRDTLHIGEAAKSA